MDKKRVRTLIKITFNDTSRSPWLFDGVHQILMTGETDLSLTHGAQVTSIPYEEIEEIKVNFQI